MSTLSAKHERFCKEYVIDHNATQAYIRCGYGSKSAGTSCARLLKNAKIIARIEELESEVLKKLASKHEITQERILLERARIAFFNAADIYDEVGKIKAPSDWGEDLGAVITSVKETLGAVTEVKLCSKENSLTALEKIHGLYEKDNEQKNPFSNLSNEELEKEIEEMEKKRESKLKKVVNI